MIKGIIANEKHSFQDFNVYINSRNISPPKKIKIKERVPFMNGSYDFSAINGECNWEERIITYVFDVAEISIEEMEQSKLSLLSWLMSIQNTEIYDEYIQNFHFFGSFDDCEWTEDSSQGQLIVYFSVYPFLISNEETIQSFSVENELEIQVSNESVHSLIPTIVTNCNIQLIKGNITYALSQGEYINHDISLNKGINNITIINLDSTTANITFSYKKEVF